MLIQGGGAAFAVTPSSGILSPFSEEVLEVTGYSDMWGEYSDMVICRVSRIDLKFEKMYNFNNLMK